jgi:hypothetical protein
MLKEFKYSSEHLAKNDYCQELTVEVDFWGQEDDYGIDEITITDEEGNVINIETLPKEEQRDIEEKADQIAYDNAYNAYQDAMIDKAEALMDYWKENGNE